MNAKYPIKLVSALLMIHSWHAANAIDEDDWTLGSIRDTKDKTDHLHLIKTLQSNSGEGLKLQVDLSCSGPGSIAATIVARDTSYMWQRSASGSRSQVALHANDALRTSIRWKIGDKSKNADVAQQKYENIVDIGDFFSSSATDQWSGNLAVSVVTNHGSVDVQTSIDTPHAQGFWKQCTQKTPPSQARSQQIVDNTTYGPNVLQAVQESKKYFDKYWAQCSNSYYLQTSDGNIREIAAVRFRPLKVEQLSEIDRLNGYQWKGGVAFTYQRYRDFHGAWTEWSGGMALSFNWCQPQEKVWKKNGEWDLDVLYSPQMCPKQPISCEAIPKD
jgi:hypothetical protein